MAFRPSDQTRSEGDISEALFTYAIHGRWNKVEEIYKNNPQVHSSKITKSGDSALILAVLDDKEKVVKNLVDLILGSLLTSEEDKIGALKLENDRGDTALHFAASLGNAVMCHAIANKYPQELVGVRNEEGETPLFVAALNGKKEAFLCLHSLIPQGKGYLYCRRADGDTFLHCALDGDYFDLAFQIIHHYRELGNYVNEQGYSPLHLLASKPSAFKSGSRFGYFDKIMYFCTFVGQLEVQDPKDASICRYSTAQAENKRSTNFPENYVTCVDFYVLFRNMIRFLFFWKSDANGKTDTESQAPPIKKKQAIPPNYDVIFDFLKLISKATVIFLGVGIIKPRTQLQSNTN